MRMQRGFTLLELMVATGIGTIVTGAVFMVMTNQSSTNRTQAELVEVQQNVRAALVSVTDAVADAGFGIPGGLTAGTGTWSIDQAAGGDAFSTCAGTDVLTVRSREPVGFWSLVTANPTQIQVKPGVDVTTVTGTYKDNPWPYGTTLLFFPSIGKSFTADTTGIRAANATNTPQSVTITTQSLFSDPTNTTAGSHVHVVKVQQFRVICVNDSNGVEQRTLVLNDDTDHDLDGAVTLADVQPIAADIEDLQVEFMYDNDRDDLPETAGTFPVTEDDVTRVKAITISLVGRTSRPLEVNNSRFVGAPVNLSNHTWTAAPGGPPYPVLYRYGRRMLRETVLLGNRNTRDPTSFPYISNQWL